MSRVVQSGPMPPEAPGSGLSPEISDSESESNEANEVNDLEAWESDDEGTWVSKPGLKWWQATFSFVVVVIGVGVMALPGLPKKGGWYMSCAAMVLLCAAVTESGIALWKGIMAGNRGHSAVKDGKAVAISSYEDLGREALGSFGESLVFVIVVLYFTGICASFADLIAGVMDNLFRDVMTMHQWMLVISPGMVALALLPNITAVARFVPVAVGCIVIFVLIMIIKSIMDGQLWEAWQDLDETKLHKLWPDSPMAMGTVVATLFGAFGVNGNVPSVLCEMEEPLDFPFAFRAAMMIVLCIYAAVMCSGYYGYGQFMQSDIILNMESFPANQAQALNTPYDQWTGPKATILGVICNSLLLVKLIVGFPLNIQVIFYSFQTWRYSKDYVPLGSWANKAMRVGTVVILVLLMLSVSEFNKLFALVCSVFGPMLQCFLPLFLSYVIRKKTGARMSGGGRRVVHAVIAVFGIFSLTIGFYMAVSDIING
ncbi:unnamed protein product [Polarella glacialis]|uniref:Amino acid transporter transmembrane domain-containing protein n=2 Tax=Polarella glacialis TaxID=89957 RepID=A0A813IPR4_POLGL|nr:unnamed protein product [Polarella glacialis]|mmetsp:Transcript_22015/g.35320  ORF Transcript_22015/g.35320 Transcript_22015/m.35320 type:complete len:484 (-) Transcript_22015:181-1632(-)